MRYILISLFILILGFFELTNPVKSAVAWVFTPFQFGLKQIADSSIETMKFFGSLNKVRQNNLFLLERTAELESKIVELKNTEEENRALREQLEIENTFERNLLLANIMGNAQDLTGSTFVLDRGSSHGVKAGDNVIRRNYLVGIVREVSAQRSLADYVTSPSSSIAVVDLDEPSRTEGLAEGQYGSSIVMKRVLPNENIGVGDMIVTSGKDGVYLPGLIIGKVTRIVEVPTEPLKSAYLETIIDLTKLSKVFILTSPAL